MSKPLQARPQAQAAASKFHEEVFAKYAGPHKVCYLCNGFGATDAAHVIGRAHLGPLRYANPRLARPAHRKCHEKVDRHEIAWPINIRRDAVKAHNLIAKIKMEMPDDG